MKDVVTSEDRRAEYLAAGLWTDDTLAARVTAHAVQRPDSVAVIDGHDGRRIAYKQLLQDASRFAGYLERQGLAPGDAVSVQLPNWYEAVAVDLGVLLMGGVLNPLLPNYREHELRGIMERANTRALVTPDVYRDFDFAAMGRQLCDDRGGIVHVVADPAAPDNRRDAWVDILNDARGGRGTPRPASEVSEVIFTSGTEARPKAVMHTEQTTNAAVRLARDALGLDQDDVVWMPSPVGHSTGLNYGIRLALYLGLPLVLQDRWDAGEALDLVRANGCTYTVAATTFLADLVGLAETRRVDLPTLRLFGCGGAPVPAELVRRASERGIQVLRLYGSTEGLVVTWNLPVSPQLKRERTDGPPLEHMEVTVRDEQGVRVEDGLAGELWIRGPSACVGYFDDEDRTNETFKPEGWIRTGDLGVLDADGYLAIVGRKKEIIIRGGMNITPREIEDLIVEIPGVEAVAVVGLPDERLGEIVCACVVATEPLALTLEAVVDFLRERQLATYKLPQRLVMFDDLPRTASGKIRKTVVADCIVRSGRGASPAT